MMSRVVFVSKSIDRLPGLGRVTALLLLLLAAGGCKRSEAATRQSQELFASACARCHGPDGAGGLPLSAGGPAPRNFRDHDFQLSRTDDQLKQTIRNGKGSGMPPFGTLFDEAQLTGLVTQIRSFDPQK
jgi:mono/diheme cytochrome c family protein